MTKEIEWIRIRRHDFKEIINSYGLIKITKYKDGSFKLEPTNQLPSQLFEEVYQKVTGKKTGDKCR